MDQSGLDILLVALVGLPDVHGIGGIQTTVAQQARWLAEGGHRVRLVTTDHPDGRRHEVRDGLEITYLAVTKRDPGRFRVADWHRATVMAWPEVLAAGRPDVVHGHAEAEVGLVRSGVLAACAVPVTATLYGSPLAGVLDHLRIGRRPGSGWRGVWRALCGAAGVGPTFGRRRDYRRRRVIVLSRRQAQLVRWSYGPRTAEVIYPGIDVEVYTPADGAARVAARRRFGLPAGAFVWAFVGRLGYGKGADVTLRALAAAGRPEDRLLVVGEGPEEPGLRALARTVGCADRVHFAGPLSAPLAAYQAADALLFPTRHEESFGLVVAEAMACGLPVVASRRGAVGEVIGRAGLVLPPDDVRTWSAAMRRLATDEPGRAELARAARRRAVRHLGHELTVQQLERRYVALAAGRATT